MLTEVEKIEDLENRLREAEDVIEAIKAGYVDAFAVKHNGSPEVYTLQSADYTYRLLIEKIGESALSVTNEGLIVYCNSSFQKVTDEEENLTGTYIYDLIEEDYRDLFRDLLQAATQGQSKGEVVLTAGGKRTPVHTSITNLHPYLPAFGIVMTDLTEERHAQALIDDYRVKLEGKIKQLHEANKELEQFAYIISHDLKEPLRKISTYGEWLKKGLNSSESLKDSMQSLEVIRESAGRMRALIDDLLSYTTATNHDPADLGSVNLNHLIKKVESDLEMLIMEKGGRIILEPLPTVKAIPSQLSRLFQNLIVNALKFSKNTVPSEIRISSERVDGTEIEKPGQAFHRIAIKDNGIGFDPQQKKRIFVIFQRLHTTREFPGTGIGLAICKRIAENHYGTLTADSKRGEGATFYLYLPA